MDITRLLSDFQIPFQTGGKNVGKDWIGLSCPFCDDPSYHLGYNLKKKFFHCWRCGTHPITTTISKLLSINENQVSRIIQQYNGATEADSAIIIKPFQFPTGTMQMTNQHKTYLENRKFNPEILEKEWGLLGTGPVSKLDNSDYKLRIIAPIYWGGKIVSFQGRSLSNKTTPKYKACPKNREIISHKHILYGKQSKWKSTGICVEGITDVWRLGIFSFATFGIEYTSMQARIIANSFKSVLVLFDNEPQAQLQADKLVAELKFRGVNAKKATVKDDPGNMLQNDADYLIKQYFC